METKEYCDNMIFELGGWKSKIDEVVARFDHASTGEKERIVPEVNGLHIISDELDDRLRGLCNACDINYQPQMEDHDVAWPEQSASTWDRVSLSDIGG